MDKKIYKSQNSCEKKNLVPWESMPNDLWREVFQSMEGETLLRIASANKKFRALGNDERLWEKRCGMYRNKPDYLSWKRFYFQFARYSQRMSFMDGNEFTVLKTPSGLLYSFGYNLSGQLGHWNDDLMTGELNRISFACRIIQVSVGFNHCLALAEDFSCWGWGDNFFQQLGIPAKPRPDNVCPPQPITRLEAKGVIQLCGGKDSSFALTSSGEIWEWGQINKECVPMPRINPFFRNKNIVRLYPGSSHTLALNDKGRLYSFCSNRDNSGQLGNEEKDNEPFLIKSFPPVKQVTCHHNHYILVSNVGDYFQGRLGFACGISSAKSIKSLEGLDVVQLNISCLGLYANCFALLKDGRVMKWEMGQETEAKEVDKYLEGHSTVSVKGYFSAGCQSEICYAFGYCIHEGHFELGYKIEQTIHWPVYKVTYNSHFSEIGHNWPFQTPPI